MTEEIQLKKVTEKYLDPLVEVCGQNKCIKMHLFEYIKVTSDYSDVLARNTAQPRLCTR